MGYTGPYSLSDRVVAEVVGSIIAYVLGVGGVANALLPKTKGQGMGFLSISICAGLGITLPIIMFNQVSGWFNPSFLIALWVRGQLSAGDFFALFAADLAGYFLGACLLWLFYLPHFNCAVDPPACTEVEALLTDPARLTQPALLNASFGLGLPRITSPAGLWAFFLGELRDEMSRVARARRVADPLDRCATGLRAVHSCAKLHRSSSGLEQGDRGLEQHSHMEAAAAAAAAAAAGGGGGKGAAAGGMQWGAGPGPTLGEQLQYEADPRRRVVYALTKARQDVVLSVFCTRPAVFSPLLNLIQEFVATGLLVTVALMVIVQARFLAGDLPSLWVSQSAVYAGGSALTLCILALGGPTGPAMNAARDLAPRLAHYVLPIPGKGCSEFYYGWVPVVGTLAGGAAAGRIVDALVQLLRLD